MTTENTGSGTRSEATRLALLSAASSVFAKFGYEAVSTREIAKAAKVHPALIGYHFGSKEGLYLAVFEVIAFSMEQRLGPALEDIDSRVGRNERGEEAQLTSFNLLETLCLKMFATFADEASGPWGPLMMREQQSPSQAFDLIYERFMKRMLATMTRLVRSADPYRSEASAKLTVVSLMGQIMVFRVAREGVIRHMGWKSLGPKQIAIAEQALRDNIQRLCGPTTKENPQGRISSKL